ncbi:response regulator [Deinococcus sp.]|uniref:response regulator n=1 Tax=Deinococcus sp. TaxID=47478 RepID=UPI0025D11F27|nr:response regulator [Deinococcus sp.]
MPPAQAIIQILLVEDNEPDVILTQEAFLDAGLPITLHVARDGVEAMQFLRREPPYSGAVRPDVILLDINMPRKNGLEVLADLKADVKLRTIPVVVLTTSQADEDILRSYQSHASSYVVKPVEFSEFHSAIQALGQYMLSTVKLPPRS